MVKISVATIATAFVGALASISQAAPLLQALGGITGKAYNISTLQTLFSAAVLGQATYTELSTALSSGNFTLFVPTDTAFTSLLTQLGVTDAAALANIAGQVLQYHVSTTVVDTAYLAKNKNSFIPTALGNDTLSIIDPQVLQVVNNGNVSIRSAYGVPSKVIDSIPADNGIIHVLDTVLLPPGNLTTTLALLSATPGSKTNFTQILGLFTSFGAALPAASALSKDAPVTIFVPTDAAVTAASASLSAIPASNLTAAVGAILSYHIVTGAAAYLPSSGAIKTSEGESVNIVNDATGVSVNGIPVVDTIILTNGVAHIINSLLVPPTLAAALGGGASTASKTSAAQTVTSAAAAATSAASSTPSASATPKAGSASAVTSGVFGMVAAAVAGVALL
ncbi:hypothetical protein HDU93_005719 [Gonapodya sp. JEL0774]|nr:hypothetical protein HDU93_005719 [Gonapodya sp. JEL0774]